MRARRRKADFEHRFGAAAGVEYGAPATIAVRIEEVGDRRIEARLPQRFHDQAAFPRSIMRLLPMLQRAAAAHAEMWTERLDAGWARGFDAQKLAPVGMTRDILDFDRFARQGPRHKDRAGRSLRQAVAAMADADNREPLNHARPR